MPIRRISVATCRRPTSMPPPEQQIAQHPGAGERMLQVQLVDAAHQRQVGGADRLGVVVDGAAADGEQLGLPLDGQRVGAVDHRFALSSPALVSAPSKKSFSSASWPILACSAFRSTGGCAGVDDPPNTSAAR